MSTPITDEAFDKLKRGACGLIYVGKKMRQLEAELNKLKKENACTEAQYKRALYELKHRRN
jgi:hypothetical protein